MGRAFVLSRSPFVARLRPVDSRIILSLLGSGYRYQMNFMYLNAECGISHADPVLLIFPCSFAARRLGHGGS